jgi:hypothetical protein
LGEHRRHDPDGIRLDIRSAAALAHRRAGWLRGTLRPFTSLHAG